MLHCEGTSSLPASFVCEDIVPRDLGADAVERLPRRAPGQLDGEQVNLGLIDECSAPYPVLVEQPMCRQWILPIIMEFKLLS